MAYYIDGDQVSLDALQKRIEKTDLVPSRISLLDGLAIKFKAFVQNGLSSLADLRKELKTPKRLASLADVSGVAPEYLILLRREIEGYFPEAFALHAFDGFSEAEIKKIKTKGVCNTTALYEATRNEQNSMDLVHSTGVRRSCHFEKAHSSCGLNENSMGQTEKGLDACRRRCGKTQPGTAAGQRRG